ncbi:hypothetical protein RJ641_029130 [Dillenia turbinata]|uniref:Protein DCL, chloroplastic n=1 Tax=Dillenia turbinata TaxID=194707 RepID=A0AAN8ZG06_9MAGN
MSSISNPPPKLQIRVHRNPISSAHSSPCLLSFPFSNLSTRHRLRALKTRPDSGGIRSQEPLNSDFLRKPVMTAASDDNESAKESGKYDYSEDVRERERYKPEGEENEWVDWEDQILSDTVPLVGFVRMVLHSGRYANGDRLTPEHENTILERLLPYHPDYERKIGCGVDYITVGFHPEFEESRCLFIVRKDGELVDFSYWKCIKGLIRKKYPLYADSFILRHFRRRSRSNGR